ncbi:hypothetical protein [Carnimonas bestiolae]|uniref:hypothetical protein n=1 Tax=Carnimonas bestiolae TaxID=3402172 RepID=UPI003EDC3A0E
MSQKEYSLSVSYQELTLLIEQVVQRDPDTTHVDVLALAGKLTQPIIDRKQGDCSSLHVARNRAINGDTMVTDGNGNKHLEAGFRAEYGCWGIYHRSNDGLAEWLSDQDAWDGVLRFCAHYFHHHDLVSFIDERAQKPCTVIQDPTDNDGCWNRAFDEGPEGKFESPRFFSLSGEDAQQYGQRDDDVFGASFEDLEKWILQRGEKHEAHHGVLLTTDGRFGTILNYSYENGCICYGSTEQ